MHVVVLFATAPAHALAGGMPVEQVDQVIATITADAVAGRSGVDAPRPEPHDERFSRDLTRGPAPCRDLLGASDDTIVSADTSLSSVRTIRRVDPSDERAVRRLLA